MRRGRGWIGGSTSSLQNRRVPCRFRVLLLLLAVQLPAGCAAQDPPFVAFDYKFAGDLNDETGRYNGPDDDPFEYVGAPPNCAGAVYVASRQSEEFDRSARQLPQDAAPWTLSTYLKVDRPAGFRGAANREGAVHFGECDENNGGAKGFSLGYRERDRDNNNFDLRVSVHRVFGQGQARLATLPYDTWHHVVIQYPGGRRVRAWVNPPATAYADLTAVPTSATPELFDGGGARFDRTRIIFGTVGCRSNTDGGYAISRTVLLQGTADNIEPYVCGGDPPTLAPPTPLPPTPSPPTPVPPTPVPQTPVPPTPIPPTPVPPTPLPPTPLPPTPLPPTPVPPTPVPPTPVPPTPIPPTPAPSTPVPPTPLPPTPLPRTPLPPTPLPLTPVPPTPVPPTPVPPTPVPPTPIPPTPAPPTPVPPTPVPPTPLPPTLAPPTSVPPTRSPPTPLPATPSPPTSSPPTLAPPTLVPPTPAPPTLSPPTPAPSTWSPPTPVPPTLVPPSPSPSTPIPPTLVPATPVPATVVPETAAPATLMPRTIVPRTMVPPTQAPPPPAAVPPKQKERLRQVGKAASAASVLAGSAVVAGNAGKLAIVRSFGCDMDDVDLGFGVPLDFEFHPTGVEIGEGPARYLVGAVVMNIVVFVGFGVFAMMITMVVKGCLRVPIDEAMGKAKTPGVLLIPFAFLLPGTSLVSCRLLFFPEVGGFGGAALGAMGLVFCLGVPLVMYVGVLRHVPTRAHDERAERIYGKPKGAAKHPGVASPTAATAPQSPLLVGSPQHAAAGSRPCRGESPAGTDTSNDARADHFHAACDLDTTSTSIDSDGDDDANVLHGWRRWLYLFVFGDRIWVSTGGDTYFCDQYGLMFDNYERGRCHLLLVEFAVTILLSLFSVWKPGSDAECSIRNVAITLILTGFFVVLMVTWPFLSVLENVMAVLLAGGTAVAVLLMSVGIGFEQGESSPAFALSGWCLLLSAWLVIVKAVWDIALYLYDIIQGRKADARRARRTEARGPTTPEENAGGSAAGETPTGRSLALQITTHPLTPEEELEEWRLADCSACDDASGSVKPLAYTRLSGSANTAGAGGGTLRSTSSPTHTHGDISATRLLTPRPVLRTRTAARTPSSISAFSAASLGDVSAAPVLLSGLVSPAAPRSPAPVSPVFKPGTTRAARAKTNVGRGAGAMITMV